MVTSVLSAIILDVICDDFACLNKLLLTLVLVGQEILNDSSYIIVKITLSAQVDLMFVTEFVLQNLSDLVEALFFDF